MIKNLFENLIDKHPLIVAVLFFLFLTLFLKWLLQPIEIIYDPTAPPYWIDDDSEGGYFPRR